MFCYEEECWGKLSLALPALGAFAAACVQACVRVSFCCPPAFWGLGMRFQSVTEKMNI